MNSQIRFFFGFICVLCLSSASAEQPTLRVCTQNLHRFGEAGSARELPNGLTQQDVLVRRMIEAKCDIIGVQEVFGESEREASRNLERLSRALQKESGRTFRIYLGESERDPIRTGYLVAADVSVRESTSSLAGSLISGLSPLGPSHRPTRPPFGLLVEVRPKSGASTRKLFLANIHLKSKLGGWKDPTETNFETLRMEVAEATREWVRRETARVGGNTIGIILGDRNSAAGSAAAEVLRGARHLVDFRKFCSVDRELEPKCDKSPQRAPGFVPLLEQTKEASYRYKGKLEVIDEILIEGEDAALARGPGGIARAGVAGKFNVGSDHKLVWAELNW